jgi:hypothetical protein
VYDSEKKKVARAALLRWPEKGFRRMPEKDFRRRMPEEARRSVLFEVDLRKEVTKVNVGWLDQ